MSTEQAQARSSRTQIIEYGGRSFVTGLRWHPLGSVTGYMREARQFGREHSLDIVAIRRTSSIIQAGFVARSDGVTKGMYSLAATLAGQLGESWIAAWQVEAGEDRYAVVAVHQGAIIPGCDLVGTEAEIRRRVAQQQSRGISFSEWYLPAEFEMGGAPLDVDALLGNAKLKREYRLRPLVFGLSKAELAQLVVIVLVLAGLGTAWMQWQAYQRQQELEARLEAERQRLAELDRLSRETGVTQHVQALSHPWATLPSVPMFLHSCSAVIYKLPLAIDGWLFQSANCNGSLISSTYKRSGLSTSAQLIDAIAHELNLRPQFQDQGNTATLSYSISIVAAGDDELKPADPAVNDVTSWFHSLGHQPALREVPVVAPQPQALPGQPAPPPPPAPDWRHFEFKFSTLLLPLDVLAGGPTQGMRLRDVHVELTAQQLNWTVTGDLYAK